MKKHLPKSNRNQFNTPSNDTNNLPTLTSTNELPDRVPSRVPGSQGPVQPSAGRQHPARSDQPPPPRRIALIENDDDSILTIEKAIQSAAVDWRLEIHSSTEQALREIPARAPSVAVIAAGLPGLPLAESVHRLKVLMPAMPVLILSANPEASDVIRCLAAGAAGHLVKSTPADEFLSALHRALEGETVLCPHTQAALANYYQTNADRPRTRRLTPREEEVLGYVGQGLLNKEIADKLGTSVATVHAHIANILTRLEVHDRHAACRQYQRLQPSL